MIIDTQGTILAIRPELSSLFGYTPAELMGQKISSIMTDSERFLAQTELLFTADSSCLHDQLKVVLLHRNGQKIPLILQLTGVRRGDGQLYSAISVLSLINEFGEDVQDFAAVESVSNDARQLFAILDTTVEGIITIDALGYIEVFNRGAEKLFGYRAEEILGQNIRVLMPAPYCENHDGYLARYRATGEKKIIGIGREVVGQRKDGSTFPAELSVSEVRLKERTMFTGVIRDISDRKQMETRLVKSERLSAIGEAMTGLTHESRNALQRSQACLEMLKIHLANDSRAQQLIHGVQAAQDDLHRLYEDVIEYARPITLRYGNHSVAEIAIEAWENLARQRQSRIASMNVISEDPEMLIEVDRFALRHVFQNLFENSLAACSEPTAIKTQSSSYIWRNKPAVQILISDNGPGLPRNKRSQLFQPFVTTKIHGTGLGLAISRRLIHSHGGELGLVDNDDGCGAVFEIILPAHKEI